MGNVRSSQADSSESPSRQDNPNTRDTKTHETKSDVRKPALWSDVSDRLQRVASHPARGASDFNRPHAAPSEEKHRGTVHILQPHGLDPVTSESEDAQMEDTASYIADLLTSLENLAQRNSLTVLSLMIAMAREQASEDADLAPAGPGDRPR